MQPNPEQPPVGQQPAQQPLYPPQTPQAPQTPQPTQQPTPPPANTPPQGGYPPQTPYPPQQPAYPPVGYPNQPGSVPPGSYAQQAPYPPQAPYPQSMPYPPQQMPVQPGYPYPPQATPAPKGGGNTNGLVIGISVGVVGVLLIVFVTFFLLYTRSSTPTGTVVGTSSGGGGSLQQTVANTWDITISNVHTAKGDSFTSAQLKPGDTYLVMTVAAHNISSQQQYFYGYIDFQVSDSAGNVYKNVYFPNTEPPDGNIDAGTTQHGGIAFEVPASTHTFTLTYADDLLSAKAQWNLNV